METRGFAVDCGVFRNDYILREIEQLVQFIVRLFHLDVRQIEKLEGEVDRASREFTGLGFPTLEALPADQLLLLFKPGDRLDVTKAFASAMLLSRAAETRMRLTGDPVNSPIQLVKALILFNECLAEPDERICRHARKEVEGFLPRLLDRDWVSTDLARFYELTGQYGRAEDALFDVLEAAGDEAEEFAFAFYDRLLEKTDEELAGGNLPRTEILEALDQLRNAGKTGAG